MRAQLPIKTIGLLAYGCLQALELTGALAAFDATYALALATPLYEL